MSKGLNELRDIAHNHAKSHGFDDMNVGTQLMLIVTEVAEAMEDERKGFAPDQFTYEDPISKGKFTFNDEDLSKSVGMKPCGIPSEIADVMIRCLDFCGRFGIDIARAVEEKMAYNKTRPFKHGKIK